MNSRRRDLVDGCVVVPERRRPAGDHDVVPLHGMDRVAGGVHHAAVDPGESRAPFVSATGMRYALRFGSFQICQYRTRGRPL